ncbi:HK97 family phage prohead protease [Nonomuraea typhae]|uniref:HK97 family phage prohead protease n=1 Tax=Nonomuraea typhae TaxID=2603600 RepID=UPI0012F81675|nr:HK97 family phage prohead protease [Nonomuraea typhae]
METLRELDLVRAVPACVELRADGDGGEGTDTLGTMVGHFSVFDTWYRIRSFWEGDFMESIAPGAFRKTMAERRDQIVVAFDHGYDPVIGDKVLGPIDDLREDGTGGYYEVGLLDTSYNRDLLPALKRGLYGSSFRFQVIKDEWDDEPERSDHNPDGVPERTIREVRLYEFGPVTYPANPAATAGMRSMSGMTDQYYERLRARGAQQIDDLLARARALRTPDLAAAPAGTAEQGAAPVADEPVNHHSRGLSVSSRSRLLELEFLAS